MSGGAPHPTRSGTDRLAALVAKYAGREDVAGTATIAHVPCGSQATASTASSRLLNALVGQSSIANAHLYHATLPGAPWPLDAAVFTTAEGQVTTVVYRAELPVQVRGKVHVSVGFGLIGKKVTVQGPAAAWAEERKDLLKKCKVHLRFQHEPPLFGFHAGKERVEMKAAFLDLDPKDKHCEATIATTPSEESAFVGKVYSLGLSRALEIFKVIG